MYKMLQTYITRLDNINFSTTSPLYHTCSFKSLLYNLENDIITINDKGKPTDGRKYTDINNKRLNEWCNVPSVCLTRNPQYTINKTQIYTDNSIGFARIKLNGELLSQNYKIKPVNFWTEYDTNKIGIYGKIENGDKFGNRLYDEYEERIKGNINNLHKYILRIDLFFVKDKLNKDLLKNLSQYNYEINYTYLTDNDMKDSKRFLSTLDKQRVWYNI